MVQPKQKTPAFELTNDGNDTLRYSQHGVPSDLIRWHLHDDYELHLIIATRGRFFVGDFIGSFEPGQLVLTGPRLPHNWVTENDRPSVPLRDMLVHFNGASIANCADFLPEIGELSPLWERAKYGIEFLGRDFGQTKSEFEQIRDSQGLERTLRVLQLLRELNTWPDYRLLSTVQIDTWIHEATQQKINTVIEYVFNHYPSPISLNDVAALVGMTDSYFSSFFRKSTGHRFIEFLNRVRISRACTLLSATDQQITRICFEVGFNNVANFNRRFHELKGITPSEYRALANSQHRFLD